MGEYKKVRGMRDIMPQEIIKWQYAEKIISETVRVFNYKELRTPVIEEESLFERSVGSDTDIVSKEMYTFKDKKGRNLALRPEGTASVVRAFIESGLSYSKDIFRFYYYGPMFRYDRPQKGRYRQFYQFGVELFGGYSPIFDGEVIEVLDTIIKNLKIKGHSFGINTLGCDKCRNKYTIKINEYLASVKDNFCNDCEARRVRAPLRVLDCKNLSCQKALQNLPSIKDTLCRECGAYFDEVLKYLDKKRISYNIMPRLVRGLDYYTSTVFEVYLKEDTNAIAAGGRYNSLVKELGGKDVPAVGFAIGMERLLELIEDNLFFHQPTIYMVCMGKEAQELCLNISEKIRKENISVEMNYDDKPLKAALKSADRAQSEWCLILGEREIEKGVIFLKNMVKGTQEEVKIDTCVKRIKELLIC